MNSEEMRNVFLLYPRRVKQSNLIQSGDLWGTIVNFVAVVIEWPILFVTQFSLGTMDFKRK